MRVTIFQTNGSADRKDLNTGATLGTLKVSMGSSFNPTSHRLLVNGNPQPDSYILSEGDTVDVVPTKTAGAR